MPDWNQASANIFASSRQLRIVDETGHYTNYTPGLLPAPSWELVPGPEVAPVLKVGQLTR